MPALPANSPAHRILNDVFGYSSFRTGQEEVINNILDGISVLTVMPTGSGKSLCFQIPALVRVGLTVVVSPLVALMEDQVAALKLDGVAAETINSLRMRETNVDTWRRANPDLADVYTWWSYRTNARARNIGWRLDYCCVDEALWPRVSDARIYGDVAGSDHCPVGIDIA